MTRAELLLLIKDRPYRSFIKYLNANQLLLDVTNLIGQELSQQSLYDFIYPERKKVCKFGNTIKFFTFSAGYRFCNITSKCQCNKESASNKIKNIHSQRDEKSKELINCTKKETFIKKYGVDHPMKDKSIRIKVKNTLLEKYGDTNYNNRAKAEETCLEKYNVKNPLLDTNIYAKSVQTRLARYGDEHYSNPNQTKITKEQKYGHKSYNNRAKAEETCIEKYDASHYSKTIEYKVGIRTQNTSRWTLSSAKNVVQLLNNRDWLFNQYVTLKKTATQISDEIGAGIVQTLNALRNFEIDVRHQPGFSIKCIQWLEFIMQSNNIYIQHALNDGEMYIKELNYRVDGYCLETNTVYEFYGNYWHGNPEIFNPLHINERVKLTFGELYNRTIIRENTIKDSGYNLVTIWEDKWNKEKHI